MASRVPLSSQDDCFPLRIENDASTNGREYRKTCKSLDNLDSESNKMAGNVSNRVGVRCNVDTVSEYWAGEPKCEFAFALL